MLGAVGILAAILTASVKEPRRQERQAASSMNWAELWAYMGGAGRGLWPLFLGTALLLLLNFGYIAWLPTMLMRVHGWTLTEAGVAVGMAGMAAGLLGMILAGALCEWWQRRGRVDGIQRAAINFAAAGLVPLLAAPLMPTGGTVVLMAFPALLCTVGVSMLPQLATQIVVPNQLRGRVLAVYLLLVSGLSAGVGPTLVAAFTDYVYADDSRLHLAMATAGFLTAPLALFLLVRGLPYFRALAEHAPR
jgi:sugar phosphate permease